MSYEKDFFSARLLKEITPSIPLEMNGDSPGYKMISEQNIKDAINLDLKSILLTRKGERFNTSFGVGLKSYLFENLNTISAADIRRDIQNQIRSYMPWLSSIDVKVRLSEEDQSLYVKIKYKINNPEIIDYFDLSLSVSDL